MSTFWILDKNGDDKLSQNEFMGLALLSEEYVDPTELLKIIRFSDYNVYIGDRDNAINFSEFHEAFDYFQQYQETQQVKPDCSKIFCENSPPPPPPPPCGQLLRPKFRLYSQRRKPATSIVVMSTFWILDKNGDDKLSQNEFMGLALLSEEHREYVDPAELLEIFNWVDCHWDGLNNAINYWEFFEAFESVEIIINNKKIQQDCEQDCEPARPEK